MSKSVGIPEFVDGDAKSMSVALRAMKQILETLTGQRQGDSLGSPAVYVQVVEPKVKFNRLETGDFWINPDENKLYGYYNGSWQVLG
ncbi:MAG: hypothetical protein ACR2JS_01885 [Candidatus Nanopelagicales bacterium]